MFKCFRKISEYLNRAEEPSGQHAVLNSSDLSIMCHNLIHPSLSAAPILNVSILQRTSHSIGASRTLAVKSKKIH